MSSPIAPLSETPECDASSEGGAGDGRAAGRLERQLRMLDELAGIGLQIARAVERQVTGADPAPSLAELDAAADAYARVARAVRQSILLQSRLVEDRRRQDEADRSGRLDRRREHADRVRRIIGRMAQDVGEDPEAAEVLAWEAAERLRTDDVYGEVLNRPVGELVALICRDLGLDPDWSLWAAEPWSGEAAALAGTPRPSPLAEAPGADAASGRPAVAANDPEMAPWPAAETTFRPDTG